MTTPIEAIQELEDALSVVQQQEQDGLYDENLDQGISKDTIVMALEALRKAGV